jgi:hypothetical protein
MISDAALRRVLAPSTARFWGDLVRALLWGGALLIWISFAQIYVRMIRLTLADPAHSDFTIFYYTARLVAEGQPMYGASPARYGIAWTADYLGNLNPPHVQAMLQPLAGLTYGQALFVWVLINGIALIASLFLIARALGITPTLRRVVGWGALITSAAPFTVVAVTSELTFLLMVPMTLAWIAVRERRWTSAGAWLGACASFKLFLLLFLPWLLLTRRWRALAAALAALGGVVAIGIVLAGVEPYRLWVESLGQVGWWWLPMNASWQGVVSRLFEGGRTVTPVYSWPALVPPLSLVGTACIGLVTLWSAAKAESHGRSHDFSLLIVLLGAILASPLGWVYYLPLALGPAIAVFWTGEWRIFAPRWLVAGGIAAIGLWVPLEQASAGQPTALATMTFACSYFVGTAVPWLTLTANATKRS